MRPRRRRREGVDPIALLYDYAYAQVRAGVLSDPELHGEVTRAAIEDVGGPDPVGVARDAVQAARGRAQQEQAEWAPVTDHDRLVACFERLRTAGVTVLVAVDDHWSAAAELERRDQMGESLRGIAWFTLADVWHAVEHGMLEVNLWHGDSANVAPGDRLLAEVVEAFAAQGLSAHFDEGRIEVSALWQRRLP